MEDPVNGPVADNVFLIGPVAHSQPRQIGGTHSGGFHTGRPLDRGSGDIGLHLHQQVVGGSAAVYIQGRQLDAGVRLHSDQDVVDLICQRFHGGTNDVILIDTPGNAHDGAPGVLIPVGRTQARESGNHIAAVGVLHLTGIVLGFEIFYARMQVLEACRLAGISAQDAVFSDFRDTEGLEEDLKTTRGLGFDGKTVIHPSQIDIVNRAFTPSDKEIRNALKIVAALEQGAKQHTGVVVVDGSMVDKPVEIRARTVLDQARAAGLLGKERL